MRARASGQASLATQRVRAKCASAHSSVRVQALKARILSVQRSRTSWSNAWSVGIGIGEGHEATTT